MVSDHFRWCYFKGRILFSLPFIWASNRTKSGSQTKLYLVTDASMFVSCGLWVMIFSSRDRRSVRCFGSDWNISTTIGLIALKFHTDFHVAQTTVTLVILRLVLWNISTYPGWTCIVVVCRGWIQTNYGEPFSLLFKNHTSDVHMWRLSRWTKPVRIINFKSKTQCKNHIHFLFREPARC